MPIYEYKCQQCGAHFEKRQNVSDEPLTTCEKCHGKLEKQWSLSGFQFKGAGWYVTDYAGKSGGAEKSGGTEKSSSGESTGSSDSASKPTDSTTTATGGGTTGSGSSD
jgi:putative FmdB family regulatory protein